MIRALPPANATQDGRLIGYARVSTTDQKLGMQVDLLRQAGCENIFTDHGVSGAKAERPGLNRALANLRSGDSLVVYKLDRLGRSVLHLADLVTRLDSVGVQFCSLTEGIDTSSPGGKLVFHIFAAVAEFGRDLIRENTLEGLRAAKDRGVQIGRPPLLSDDEIIEAQRYMIEEGLSQEQMADRLAVSTSTLQRALKRSPACV